MRTLSASLLLLPAVVLPAAQPPTRTETRTEALAPGSKLWVVQRDGSLQVRGWDKPEVSILAEFHDGHQGKAVLEVRRVAEGLELEVKEPRHHRFILFGHHLGSTCNLTLMVPRKLAMAAKTVDGNLTVRDLEGYADLHTVDGDIRVEDLAGEVKVRTVDGRIDARNLKARMAGGTVDGRITLEGVEGGVDLHTVDGSITASGLDGWGEGITLATVDGAIHVSLGGAKGHLEASTVDGRIRADHPALAVEESRKHHLRGRIPGREQAIRLKTVDGGIHID